MNPFDDALSKVMRERAGSMEFLLRRGIRVLASDAIPEGEVRFVDLSHVVNETRMMDDGTNEHWLTMPGHKPVMYARSGVRVEGNTFTYWVDDV